MFTIGLLWHSVSSDNLGVGALTESQIAICVSAAKRAGVDVQFMVFGTRGASRYAPEGVRLIQGSRISIKKMLIGKSPFLEELKKCDLVLDIGEGDSFTDIYGLKRFLFLITSKIAVLAKRVPLILSPQTIGPFDHWITRKLACTVMKRCRRVFARDELSSAYLWKMGVSEDTDEVIDVAFRLPFQAPPRKDDGKVRIGLNISGLLFSGGYSGGNQFGLTLEYQPLIRTLLDYWQSDPKNEIWLIPHVLSDDFPNDDDRVAISAFMKEFPDVRRAPDFRSPSEAKSFISGMDFMTGARMHACIAAFSTGVPVVPLAYSRKFNGLFDTLKYPWVADGKNMTTEEAFEKIRTAFERRKELVGLIAEGNVIATTALSRYEGFLTETIRAVTATP